MNNDFIGDLSDLGVELTKLEQIVAHSNQTLYAGFFEHLVLRLNDRAGKMTWVARYKLDADVLRELEAIYRDQMLSHRPGGDLKMLDVLSQWLDLLTPRLRLRKLNLLLED